jgi:hypothetical protein
MKNATIVFLAIGGAAVAYLLASRMKKASAAAGPSIATQIRNASQTRDGQPSRAAGTSKISNLGSAVGQVGSALLNRYNSAGNTAQKPSPDLSSAIASLF